MLGGCEHRSKRRGRLAWAHSACPAAAHDMQCSRLDQEFPTFVEGTTMSSFRMYGFALTTLLSVGAVNCSSSEADIAAEDFTAKSQVAKSNIVGEVEAIRIRAENRTITIGAPKKMTRALKALGIEAKQSVPEAASVAHCQFKHKIALLDASNTVLASGGFCGQDGYIALAGQPSKAFRVKGLSTVRDIADEEPLLGDVIYGITSADVSKVKGGGASATVGSDGARSVIAVLDKNAALIVNPVTPKCLPSYAVSLLRSDVEAVSFSFSCGAPPSGNVTAYFSDEAANTTYAAKIAGGEMRDVIDELLATGEEEEEEIGEFDPSIFTDGRLEGDLEEVSYDELSDAVALDYEAFSESFGEPDVIYQLLSDVNDEGEDVFAFENFRIGGSKFAIVSTEVGCLASGNVVLVSGGSMKVTYDDEANCGAARSE